MVIECRYPHIKIDCDTVDGNALGIVSKVSEALKEAGVSEEEVSEYQQDALAGDYDRTLQASLRMVSFH